MCLLVSERVQVDLLPHRNLVQDGKLSTHQPSLAPLRVSDAHNVHLCTRCRTKPPRARVRASQAPAHSGSRRHVRILAANLVVDCEDSSRKARAQLHPLRLSRVPAPAARCPPRLNVDGAIVLPTNHSEIEVHNAPQDIRQRYAPLIVVAAPAVRPLPVVRGVKRPRGALVAAFSLDQLAGVRRRINTCSVVWTRWIDIEKSSTNGEHSITWNLEEWLLSCLNLSGVVSTNITANCIIIAQFPIENHSAQGKFAELPLKTIGESAKFGRLLCNSQYD